jgi:hypothetical protein
MNNKINAILIHEVDDVATAIVEFHKGDFGRYRKQDQMLQVVMTEDVPKYHKFAVRDIRKAEFVRKYGEIIGEAVHDIGKGCYVHDHNITSPNQGENEAGE